MSEKKKEFDPLGSILEDYTLDDVNETANYFYKQLSDGKTVTGKKPKAYILGGQAGAGKTTLQNMIIKDNPDAVIINADVFRTHHPHYEMVYNYYKEQAAEHTQSFANAVANVLVEKFSRDNFDIVVEGTCRRADVPLKTCKDFKEKGYDVELMVMCCNKYVSWQSTVDRFNLMKSQGLVPRAVPRLKYNEMISNLPDNINFLYNSGEFDEITLWDREENELYRMTDTPDFSPYRIIDDKLNNNFIITNCTLVRYVGNEHNVVIPNGITAIQPFAFKNNYAIKNITIPDSVTKIGEGAFKDCTSLENITIPDSVFEIGYCAFENCNNLKSLSLPKSCSLAYLATADDCEVTTRGNADEELDLTGQDEHRGR